MRPDEHKLKATRKWKIKNNIPIRNPTPMNMIEIPQQPELDPEDVETELELTEEAEEEREREQLKEKQIYELVKLKIHDKKDILIEALPKQIRYWPVDHQQTVENEPIIADQNILKTNDTDKVGVLAANGIHPQSKDELVRENENTLDIIEDESEWLKPFDDTVGDRPGIIVEKKIDENIDDWLGDVL